ncbi:MAG: hypothetical protein HYV07_20940 [Deltaproteobacteria bacterium]|nr:hypothetical protein [Deltaproteobacteria bacterium]
MGRDPLGVCLELGRALEDAGFDYAVGGALALGYWAVPRATLDIDVGVDADPLRIWDLIETMRRAGCELDPSKAFEAAQRGDFGARKDGVRIDVFLPNLELARAALERRVQIELSGRKLWIVSAEDLALLKLMFGRTKDFADLERLFALRADSLDFDYLTRGVEDMFPVGDVRRVKFEELREKSGLQSAVGRLGDDGRGVRNRSSRRKRRRR